MSQMLKFASATQIAVVAPTAAVAVETVFSAYQYTGTGGLQALPTGVSFEVTPSLYALTVSLDSNIDIGAGPVLDTNGNIIDCATQNSGYYAYLRSVNKTTGVINWAVSINAPSGSTGNANVYAYCAAIDSNNNIGVTGILDLWSTAPYPFVASFNESGVLQWQMLLSVPSPYYDGNNMSCRFDSTGNLYALAYDRSVTALAVVKFDTTGTLLWQRVLTGMNGASVNNSTGDGGITIDTSDNIYLMIPQTTGVTIGKYNTSGVVQWLVDFVGLNASQACIKADSAGNVNFVAFDYSGDSYLVQLSAAGTINWQRKLPAQVSSSPQPFSGMGIDVADNIYFAAGSGVTYCAKYNASGVLQGLHYLAGIPMTSSVTCDATNVYFGATYLGVYLVVALADFDTTAGIVSLITGPTGIIPVPNGTDSAGALTAVTSTAVQDAAGTYTASTGTVVIAPLSVAGLVFTPPTTASTGGLVWVKDRFSATDHLLMDTVQGTGAHLATDQMSAAQASTTSIINFNNAGFALGTDGLDLSNASGTAQFEYVAWNFARSANFFDIVEYTGIGTSQELTHALGVAPGMIIVKCVSTGSNWAVYHRGMPGEVAFLNTTGITTTDGGTYFGNDTTAVVPTATTFSVGSDASVNTDGAQYVAYLFAHDTTDTSVIFCDSLQTSAPQAIELGWEVQYLLVKNISVAGSSWQLFDTGRNLSMSSNAPLQANSNAAEENGGLSQFYPLPNGFFCKLSDDATYIYLAIRRGPMLPPVAATSVFTITYLQPADGSIGTTISATPPPPDLVVIRATLDAGGISWWDRIRGPGWWLDSSNAMAESQSSTIGVRSFEPQGFTYNGDADGENVDGSYPAAWMFQRNVGLFDITTYTGSNTSAVVPHNLGAVPELVIIKDRSNPADWYVYHKDPGINAYLLLDSDNAISTTSGILSASPTATDISVQSPVVNANDGYVAYLFASVAGISSVGSYTGNGTTQTIDCGFATPLGFLLIKRLDAPGNWYVWDYLQGIAAPGADIPSSYMTWNTLDDQVTTSFALSRDAANAGFVITQDTLANINVEGGQYIYLAIVTANSAA